MDQFRNDQKKEKFVDSIVERSKLELMIKKFKKSANSMSTFFSFLPSNPQLQMNLVDKEFYDELIPQIYLTDKTNAVTKDNFFD